MSGVFDDMAGRPECGHSACIQNWIETGESECYGECEDCGTAWMWPEQEICHCCGARHNDDGEEEL